MQLTEEQRTLIMHLKDTRAKSSASGEAVVIGPAIAARFFEALHALLAAHNAGAQEPVAWMVYSQADLSATFCTSAADVAQGWERDGWRVEPLYAQPQSTAVVTLPASCANECAIPLPTTDAARDADRLDWIERNHTLHKAVEFLYVVDGYQVQHTHDCCEVGDAFHGETLRDAIDAAMKAEIERIEREGEA